MTNLGNFFLLVRVFKILEQNFSSPTLGISHQMSPERWMLHPGTHPHASHCTHFRDRCGHSQGAVSTHHGKKVWLAAWWPGWNRSCGRDRMQGAWFCPGQEAASNPCAVVIPGILLGCCTAREAWAVGPGSSYLGNSGFPVLPYVCIFLNTKHFLKYWKKYKMWNEMLSSVSLLITFISILKWEKV